MSLAASLFLASHAAYASPPTNIDEVRALAAKRIPASPARSTGSAIITGTNTDEVRASVASPPSPPLSTGSAIVVGSTTDEVGAAFGRAPDPLVVRSSAAAAPAESSKSDSRATACSHSCPCHHG